MTTSAEAGLRRILLLIVVVGALGLIGELWLLEHFEEWTQWLPLAMLVAVLVASALVGFGPGRGPLRIFRAVMVANLVTGAVGIWLHFTGNRAFELEMDAAQSGGLLIWHSLRGATPALAPGAMIQLGLIGLLYTWRHPALGNENETTEQRDE